MRIYYSLVNVTFLKLLNSTLIDWKMRRIYLQTKNESWVKMYLIFCYKYIPFTFKNLMFLNTLKLLLFNYLGKNKLNILKIVCFIKFHFIKCTTQTHFRLSSWFLLTSMISVCSRARTWIFSPSLFLLILWVIVTQSLTLNNICVLMSLKFTSPV